MFGTYFLVENRDLVRKKRVFLHIVKRGIPKWTLNGEFLKNTEVLKIVRNPKKNRVILKSRDF